MSLPLDDTTLLMILAAAGLALVGTLIANLARARRVVRRRAGEGVELGPAAISASIGAAAGRPSLERLMTYVETTFAGDSEQHRALRKQLILAGFFDQRAVAVFFAARIGGAALLAVAGLLALPLVLGDAPQTTLLMGAAALSIAGYLAPTFVVSRRIKVRTAQHRAGFPDFMDLMVVCAEAGLSMESAVDRIARELVEGYPSLAENLYMTSLEIRAGKGFTEALERMGHRLGIEEAMMLATLLAQSAELGTSLSQSLRIYSDEMRHKRMSRAEEKAYALPAKLVVPLTLFVFPVLLVTIMLPVVVKVSELMGG